MGCSILLEFHGDSPELTRVLFRRDNGQHLVSVRGKTAGAFEGCGTFQWTSAVRALSALVIRSLAARRGGSAQPVICGGVGSLAASLDYAVSKEPNWLCEMFGVDCSGRAIIRRLLRISNPNRKRAGPVVIGLNGALIPAEAIQVFLDGARLEQPDRLCELIAAVEGLEEETHIEFKRAVNE